MSKKSHRRKLWKTQLICKAILNYSQAIGLLSTLEFAVFLTQKTVAYEYNCTFFQIFPLLRFISLYLDLPKPVAEVDTMFTNHLSPITFFFLLLLEFLPCITKFLGLSCGWKKTAAIRPPKIWVFLALCYITNGTSFHPLVFLWKY